MSHMSKEQRRAMESKEEGGEMTTELLLREAVELQRRHYGDATGLHLAMIGWADRASTLIAELGQEVGAVPNGKLVGWWNGITPGFDGMGVPSIRWGADAENSGHDIPLYDGYNPIHYVTPPTSPAHTSEAREQLKDDDVEWIVNDLAELGVKIGQQFFFCYKGRSLIYEEATHDDDGRRMKWRPVFKREFGECVHPVNYEDLRKCGHQHFIGTVSLDDSDDWKDLPDAAMRQEGGE